MRLGKFYLCLLAAVGILLFYTTKGQASATTPSTTTLSRSVPTPFTSGSGSTEVLTATMSAGATGTVTFKDGGTNLTCTGGGGNPATIASSVATCTTTFSTEGIHTLSAVYSGDSIFVTSTGTANIFAMNHATNVGTQYCNSGAIASTGLSNTAYSATSPYPSVIFVGDGSNTDITQTASTVSVQLKNFSAGSPASVRLLLVSPDGKAFDFFDGVGTGGSASAGNYIIQDGAVQFPQSSFGPGTFGPTDATATTAFVGVPAPAPQVPGSYAAASPAGAATFFNTFAGATSHGAWSLYLVNTGGSGHTAAIAGGWCLNISPSSGVNTTTTVTSSANPYGALGGSVTFTASIAASPTANQGTVTFTDGFTPLPGAPNSGVASVANGAATIATAGLSEGDHTIKATYHDSTGNFNDSIGTVAIRIDKPTSTPTLSASTWSYCNTGAITIPAGQTGVNDFGPASPNPSNIVVMNMPGKISSISLTMKGFHDGSPQKLETLLAGPTGQGFDFFSLAGGTSAIGPLDLTFKDGSTATPLNSPPSNPTGPASYGATSFTSSSFFALPGVQSAAPQGAFTFNTGTKTATSGGVYLATNPNGVWSLYFNQTTPSVGSGLNNGWCLNIISTPVTGTGTTAHVGPAPSNHMKQGGTGSVSFSLLNNGNGPTGDPDQAQSHALVVAGTLPAGLTLGTLPTTGGWSCTANTTTQVTCTNSNAIAQDTTYSLLTIPVNIATNATATATVSGFTFSGAGMTGGTFASDTVTIDPSPVLSLSKTHVGTFTQGQAGQWNLVVSNTAATAGATDGTTVTVSDPIPSGYTLQSIVTGNEWTCTSSTATLVTCATTQVLAGGGAQYSTITLHVNIPPASATSVMNTAKVFGGGDLTHTSSGNGASGSDTVTVVQVPANMTGAGTPQSATINTAFATALSATVTDANNVGIPNLTVTFTAPASGASGTFAGGTNVKTATTNASGVATATAYTANGTAGAYTVSATVGSLSKTYSLTNNAGTATQMSANAGTSPQSANINTAFLTPLSVTVKDALNNPVSGVTVTFTAPASGASGTFSNSTRTIAIITNALGVASAGTFTANGTAGGAYTITASAAGLTVVNFSATNLAGPVITSNPNNTTVNAGQTATFTAAASGTPTPTVQWQFSTDGGANYNNLAGATTTTLSFTASAGVNGAKYRAVFTNSGGSATTTAGTLTVNFAPSVTTNPTSQSVASGSTATFVAAASGNPTPTVQWQVSTNGGGTFTNIAGATSPTLSFTALTAQNGNQYRAVFTNTVGSATTTAATLTVTAGPTITQNPTNQTVNAGQTAMFTAAATGVPTPTVQWQFSTDGGATFNNVAGATTTTLTVPSVAAGQNGTKYRAVFTNSGGSATATAATLTVNFAPSVTTNPTSQSVASGSTATFVAAASGNPTPTVQWQISTNGGGTFVNIAGATAPTLSFTTQGTDNGNQYRAVFTNSVGSATTTAATLTVTAGPVITQNPTNQTVNAGQTATFTAAATGVPTPTVQWQFSTDGGATFNNVAGATTTTLTVPGVAAGQNGTKFRAVFTNGSGSATTTAATLTVNFAPSVTTNPTSQSVASGSTATFLAAASGNPTPTVQWQISTNGGGTFVNIAGATATTLSFTTQGTDNGNQYRAVFTNSVGSATTTAATLTVTAGPVITQNPTNQTVNNGQTATFAAAATGTPSPTVQWQISTDGGASFNNIAGATSTTLSFAASAGMNGNKYRAVFTNPSGSATTTAATLTVNIVKVTPTITWANPADIVFGSALGGTQLNATASVPGTFAYTPGLGTVLPQGNGQTLSVLFTPTDTVNYNTATAAVLINVVANQVPGQLVVSRVLTRDPNTNEIVLTLTFANTGGTTFTNLVLNKSMIGVNNPTTPALPAVVATSIPGNTSTSVVVRYPGSIGAPGSAAVLQVGAAYDQGTVSASSRIALP